MYKNYLMFDMLCYQIFGENILLLIIYPQIEIISQCLLYITYLESI